LIYRGIIGAQFGLGLEEVIWGDQVKKQDSEEGITTKKMSDTGMMTRAGHSFRALMSVNGK
jgi:hypothetical protein